MYIYMCVSHSITLTISFDHSLKKSRCRRCPGPASSTRLASTSFSTPGLYYRSLGSDDIQYKPGGLKK